MSSYVDQYNVVWNSPSTDSLDSMPLSGRRGAGANVWVQDGSIWLYLAHNGAYDEHGRLLKLGCVRITPTVTSLVSTESLTQTLELGRGAIKISAVAVAGTLDVLLWFAAENLLIEATSSVEQKLLVEFATWRDVLRTGLKLDMGDTTFTIAPDQVTPEATGLSWAHDNAANGGSIVDNLAPTLSQDRLHDPAVDRTFGGAMACDVAVTHLPKEPVRWQCWDGTTWPMMLAASFTHRVVIALRAQQHSRTATWLADARSLLNPAALSLARTDEQARWNEFWSRSYIIINEGSPADDPGWQVGKNYQLFRYMLACNRGGEFPLLFNGGIFTTDNPPGRITGNNNDELLIYNGAPTTPDYRRWLFCHFMAQNQRWLGWPMIASGDLDLLEPTLAFYRDRYATACERATGLGAQGCVYPEPLDLRGLCWSSTDHGLCSKPHLIYDFSPMIEFAWMAICAHRTLGRDLTSDIPWIVGVVRFYESFYRSQLQNRTGSDLDRDGKLVFYPCNALEYGGGATNPMEVVVGLERVVGGLLELPETIPGDGVRDVLVRVRQSLPAIPVSSGSEPVLLPGASIEQEFNCWEAPEMYAAWPYRMFGVADPSTLDLVRRTWDRLPEHRAKLVKFDMSWMPNIIWAAQMGDAAHAQAAATRKLSDDLSQVRFTAFFGPGHDWLPDHNWGGSAMTGLQEMILAGLHDRTTPGRPLVAWPAEWRVRYRLHEAATSTVDGEVNL